MKQTESKINETIVTGRKFRRLDNSITKNWDRICLTPPQLSDDFQERELRIFVSNHTKERKNNEPIGFN